jgi:transcriptional regulator with XRE-family HTH domain
MTRAHGTRACYVHGPEPGQRNGCRCAPCTEANRAAHSRESRLKAYGRWQPFVDAAPAREHVLTLRAQGMGRRRLAELSGVSPGALSKLLNGKGSRPPSRQLRAETAAAILAVSARDGLAPSAIVDATATHRRLQALMACGWSGANLAGRLGMSAANFRSLLRQSRVTAARDREVAALYDQLWDVPPPEGTHREKIAASRACSLARSHGWPVPAAWDDETIGDPAASPAEGWQRPDRITRRTADLVAEASEMAAWGWSRTDAADRLGVTRAALDKAFERARELPADESAAA